MNKKGFAVSVILYSIIFLIITTLFMLLALMRTRYNVNSELKDNIRESINEEINPGSLFPSSEKCMITTNTNNYTDNLLLTIKVSYHGSYDSSYSNGKFYSWDNETYNTNNSIKVNRAGLYTGYFKDNVGGSGSCDIEISSKTQYSYRSCNNDNENGYHIQYSDWYYDTENSGYVISCNVITLESATSTNSDTYRLCTSVDLGLCDSSTTCYESKTYKRNPIGCDTEDGSWSEWSSWSDAYPSDVSVIKQLRNTTSYKVKSS